MDPVNYVPGPSMDPVNYVPERWQGGSDTKLIGFSGVWRSGVPELVNTLI